MDRFSAILSRNAIGQTPCLGRVRESYKADFLLIVRDMERLFRKGLEEKGLKRD